MAESGMTDKQFKAFVRFVLGNVRDAAAEPEKARHDEILEKLIDKLQKTLED